MELKRYLQQLEVISNLRNLQALTVQTLDDMELTYDLKSDIRFKQGIEKGIEKGIENLLLKTNFLPEQIAGIFGVSVKVVLQIKNKLNK